MSHPWPLVPLGEVLDSVDRAESPVPGISYRQIGVRLWGEGAYEREPIDGAATRYARLSRCEADDVVVNKIWARNGSVGVVPQALAGCYGSTEFPMFSPRRDSIDPRWIHWLTKTSQFWEQCDEKSRGTSGKNRIRPERFLEVRVPLPPLPEQRRIVMRLERLADKINRAFELHRQTVEQANALVISTARTIRERLLASKLPKNRVADLAVVTAGGTPARDMPAYWNGTIPWVKTGELLDGDIYDTEERITQEGLNNSSAKVFPPGTVLVALYGQGQTRGRTGRLMIEATTNQACCAILPAPSALDSGFVQLWVRSLYSEMREESRNGAQPNWNAQMIKEIEIVVPSLSEQLRYVHFCQALQSRVAAIVKGQTEVAAEIRAMMRSTIEAAFDLNRIKLPPVTSEPRS